VWCRRTGAAFRQQVRLPEKGDAVCLAAGQAHTQLRAKRQYTVIECSFDGIRLTDAAAGRDLDGRFEPSLLAPAEEVALLALHYVLYLYFEAGVVCAVLEAYREASSKGEE